MLIGLLSEEEPPRLQAVLRMTEHLLKTRPSDFDKDPLIQVLCKQLGHSDADVRKTVVFCLVELVTSGEISVQQFETRFGLNPS